MASFILHGLAHAYGLTCYILLSIRALVDGHLIKPPTSEYLIEVKRARDSLWNLSTTTNGSQHKFFSLSSGRKLHYLLNQSSSRDHENYNLVIFVHGWPDSCMLWTAIRNLVAHTAARNTTFVAVDLPGRGGSDSLRSYGPAEMLDSLTEFVIAMRDQHLPARNAAAPAEHGKVVIVAHDWGAVCAFKLAAKAPQLADRFIISNGPLTELMFTNIENRAQAARRLFSNWRQRPTNFTPLRDALTSMTPVFSQVQKSFYVFVFNLPQPLPALFVGLGVRWFLRVVHRIALGPATAKDVHVLAAHAGASLGPSSVAACSRAPDGTRYPSSVARRAEHGAMSESTRIYSEGLAMNPWKLSPSLQSMLHNLNPVASGVTNDSQRTSISAKADTIAPPGACHSPVSVVWGAEDPALDSRIMLEGMKDYLVAPASHVIMLPNVGHWVPTNATGSRAVAEVLTWALEGEKESVAQRVRAIIEGAEVTVET